MNLSLNKERPISAVGGIILLLVAFLLSYEPWQLGLRELVRQEGLWGAITTEISWCMPIAKAHGIPVSGVQPLYPLICSFVGDVTGLPVEFAMRLVSVFMTAALGVLIYVSTKLSSNTLAAQVATATFIGANVVMEKSLDAYPTSLIAFGLLTAQLLWFYFGVRRANWNMAWIISLLSLALAFYAGGFMAVALFCFPLIFMRRPLTLWSKLNKAGFYVGGMLLIALIMLWWYPYFDLKNGESPLFLNRLNDTSFWNWCEQIIEFPFSAIVRFLPWSLIAWAPFCVALQESDETPIYSRYLRTLVISNFFLLWFLPDGESYELIYLAGPLAILTGLYYESAVRRYSRQVRFLLHGCGFFTLGISIVLILFCLLPESLIQQSHISISNSIEFREEPHYWIYATMTAFVTLIATMFLFSRNRSVPAWVLLLITALSATLFYWVVVFPYRAQDWSSRDFGVLLRASLKKAENNQLPPIIYKNNIRDLYNECRYLDIPVQQIRNLSELPASEDTIYLLTTEFPVFPERDWVNLLAPSHTYLDKRLLLLQGNLRKNRRENIQIDW